MTACGGGGDGGTTGPAPTPVTLAWATALDSLEEGTRAPSVVTGARTAVLYRVSDTTLATISAAGELTARRVGTVTVTAEAGGQTVTRPIRLVPSPLAPLRLVFTQPTAEVFTRDDTARTLGVEVVRRNGRVVTDSVPVTIALRGEVEPHGAGVLALAPVANGVARVSVARKGYWRGWAIVTAGGLRDSLPLRVTGFTARFVYEPMSLGLPAQVASPTVRAVADSAFRVWARYIMDTMPRRNLWTDSVRFSMATNQWPTIRTELANEDRLVVFVYQDDFPGTLAGEGNGGRFDGVDLRSTVGSVILANRIANNRSEAAGTLVHEIGHVLGFGDHPTWQQRQVRATRANGTTGFVLNFPGMLADLRAAGTGLPGYLTGVPISSDASHLVDVVAANDIMRQRRLTTDVLVTTASLLILRDLGYQIDFAGAPVAQGRPNAAEGW